jgi:hypothetical protein
MIDNQEMNRMQIGLTKKLAEYTGITIIPLDTAIDPFFSRGANLLIIHHRKTIVYVNNATRFAFILHSIKAADVRQLDQLIRQLACAWRHRIIYGIS